MAGLAGVTAAILAGGLGSRLRPVVADRPKVLAAVGGRPFLTYLLDQLASAGIAQVVLCTGYLGEQVRATLGEVYGLLRLVYSQESSPLGTAGALRLALPFFPSDSVLVMNGDSFCPVDLRAFWEWHGAQGAEATLLVVQAPDTSFFGWVQLDARGRVLAFKEKEKSPTPELRMINAGIYLIERRFLKMIPPGRTVSLERDFFPAHLGRKLYGYQCQASFIDIGTPETYVEAEKFLQGN